jgi:DNA-binding NtrC family response regulator
VRHFLDKQVAQALAADDLSPMRSGAARPQITVSQEAMRRLMAYHWPGNVRQLENAIERAVAFAAGRAQIDVGDLPPEIQDAREVSMSAAVSAVSLPEDGMDLDAFISNIERDLIQRSLERTGGNKGQAARLLGLKRTTLVEKLKRLDKR